MQVIDGETLAAADLVALSKGGCKIEVSEEAWQRIRASRAVIDNILAAGRVACESSESRGGACIATVATAPSGHRIVRAQLLPLRKPRCAPRPAPAPNRQSS